MGVMQHILVHLRLWIEHFETWTSGNKTVDNGFVLKHM